MYGKHYSTRAQRIIQKEQVLHSLLTTSSPCPVSTALLPPQTDYTAKTV